MRSSTRKLRDLTVFAILAAVTLTAQIALWGLSGVQLNGLIIAAVTVTYRARALILVYVYVLLYCLYYGFFPWNLPYFYIWLPLWGMFMLAGRLRAPKPVKAAVYSINSIN